jgi:hypothetical protein
MPRLGQQTLFYIRDDSDLDFNRDLFVCAFNYKHAIDMWRVSYELASDVEPVCVYALPEPDVHTRVLAWNEPDGVNRVWKSEKTFPAV